MTTNITAGRGDDRHEKGSVVEDNLPWVEKYRPDTLADVSGHKDVLRVLNRFVEVDSLPHLLFFGPPGTGKTSTILALARQMYGEQGMRQMVLELNASDDRGIDVVREQIKTFSSTRQIFSGSGGGGGENDGVGSRAKLVILDEADAMTNVAQMALRRIMEKYTANTRFCLIANYTHKLSPAILSRCTRFRFSPLGEKDIRVLVERVIENEGIRINEDAVDSLIRLSKGDMRRALNVLQACYAGAGQAGESEFCLGENGGKGEVITTTMVYDCVASPQPGDIELIRDTLLKTRDVTTCLDVITTMRNKGIALTDMITGLFESLMELEVDEKAVMKWIKGLADIEYRLSLGANETIQMGALVGIIRDGVDILEKSSEVG